MTARKVCDNSSSCVLLCGSTNAAAVDWRSVAISTIHSTRRVSIFFFHFLVTACGFYKSTYSTLLSLVRVKLSDRYNNKPKSEPYIFFFCGKHFLKDKKCTNYTSISSTRTAVIGGDVAWRSPIGAYSHSPDSLEQLNSRSRHATHFLEKSCGNKTNYHCMPAAVGSLPRWGALPLSCLPLYLTAAHVTLYRWCYDSCWVKCWCCHGCVRACGSANPLWPVPWIRIYPRWNVAFVFLENQVFAGSQPIPKKNYWARPVRKTPWGRLKRVWMVPCIFFSSQSTDGRVYCQTVHMELPLKQSYCKISWRSVSWGYYLLAVVWNFSVKK